MNNYNTQLEQLVLREYGRNVQKLVNHLGTIEDKEERSKKSATIVSLMKQINPSIQNNPEVEHKIWDDLHIISDFKLDIDGPYPTPDKEVLMKKPDRLGYSSNRLVYKHFGRNIELLVNKAVTFESKEDREAAIVHIGRLMKTFFMSYSNDSIEDDVVYKNIQRLSNNELEIDMEEVKSKNLFAPQRNPRRNFTRDNRRPVDNKSRNNNNRTRNTSTNNRTRTPQAKTKKV